MTMVLGREFLKFSKAFLACSTFDLAWVAGLGAVDLKSFSNFALSAGFKASSALARREDISGESPGLPSKEAPLSAVWERRKRPTL